MVDERADAFEARVDRGEQASDAVGGAGGLAGEIVVEAEQHVQEGDGASGIPGDGDRECADGAGLVDHDHGQDVAEVDGVLA